MIQPKIPQPTISFIDQYCGSYQKIFPEARSYIAKWWSAICCAFLLVSMRAISTQHSELSDLSTCQSELNSYLAEHPDWDFNQGWKSMLNNMQLLLLPLLALKLVEPWLKVFEAPLLVSSFNTLIGLESYAKLAGS